VASRDEALSYYKWLWRDFRANRKVQRMGYIAKGLYRELLDEAWSEGSIPTDMESLADICGCPVEVITAEWPKIAPCWIDNGNGRLVNDKLDSLRTATDAERVVKAQAGRLGGLAKTIHILETNNADPLDIERVKLAQTEAKDSLAGAKQQLADASYLLAGAKHVLEPASECHIAEQSRAEHKQSRAEISTPNGVSPRNDSGNDPIEAIYREYPRKVGKAAALKAISRAVDRLRNDHGGLREAQVYLYTRVRSYARSPAGNDGEFTPHPATWFNQGRYDDDPKEWEGRNGTQPSSTVTRRVDSPTAQRVESGVNAFRRAAIDFGATDRVHGSDGGEIPEPRYGGSSAELPLRLQPPGTEARVIQGQNGHAQPTHKAGPEILPVPRRDGTGVGVYGS
jgi:hypothetical protein